MNQNDLIQVLLIEDNEDDAWLISQALEEEFHVSVIRDGEKAYEYLSKTQSPPDVILTDYRLPSMNGLEIIHALNKEKKEFAYIVLTVDMQIETAIEAMKAGASDFLPKSKGYDDLPDMIQKAYRIHKDRKEKELMQAALRESEERFRCTFEQAAVGIAHIALDGSFLRINNKFCEISGYEEKELLAVNIQDITHPDSLTVNTEYSQKLIKNRIKTYSLEQRYLKKDGSAVCVNLTASLVRESTGEPKYFIFVLEDISERKNMENELLRARKFEAIGILAGGIAHDFNNLLFIILGNISLAKPGNEDNTSRYLNEAEKTILQAKELIKQLIIFSKAGSLDKQAGSIKEMLLKTIKEKSSAHDIKWDIELNPPWIVEFNENQMSYAVKKLLDNAIESMPGGGSIKVRLENLIIGPDNLEPGVKLNHGKYIKISIQDHGVGIPEKNLSKIFDPYFSTKERGAVKGMGMGLAVSYSIISQHNGCISVSSKSGKGSKFCIYLPAASRLG